MTLRDEIRQKSVPVRQMLSVIASKRGIDDPDFAANIQNWLALALRQWDEIASQAGIDETLLAERILHRLRSDPSQGWAGILAHPTIVTFLNRKGEPYSGAPLEVKFSWMRQRQMQKENKR